MSAKNLEIKTKAKLLRRNLTNFCENKSNPKKVIIHYDPNTAGFEDNCFSEDFLGGYITNREFNQIVGECSRRMQHCWMYVKDHDKNSISISLKLLSIIIVIILILYILAVLYILNIMTTSDWNTVYLTFFIFVFGTSITFGLSIYNYVRVFPKFQNSFELINKDLEVYFAEINKRFSHIKFNYNTKTHSIDCHILKIREKPLQENETENAIRMN